VELWVLHDSRLQIILQDGRNHLLATQKKYDVITADATHPWSADSWIWYIRGMYRLVRSRLMEQGIFCQWVPLHRMSIDDFKCILRTMGAEFPHLSLWYTGAGRGIGRSISLALADARAQVVVCSRTSQEIQSLISEIAKNGGKAVALLVDVVKEEGVVSLFETIENRFGKTDILVNSANLLFSVRKKSVTSNTVVKLIQ